MALLSESVLLFVFFNDTATTEIYTLSLHDALPIYFRECRVGIKLRAISPSDFFRFDRSEEHTSELQSPYVISYAVFCLKKYTSNLTPLQRMVALPFSLPVEHRSVL